MRTAHRNSSNLALRRGLLIGTGIAALMALPAQALAQDAAPALGQEDATDDVGILVTGIRETIQSSIATKKNETAIVDALSSEDIGNLPAVSVGQAIQTITGATTHREKGDASEIALRGLGPFLSNSTFNGREATNGSGDRAVNYNQFPSELINQIKIYKSQQANLVEGGVAGTIELGTLRPLEVKGRRIQIEAKATYTPYGDRIVGSSGMGWRGTASYVDQFDLGGLGRLGISLGFQRNQGTNPEETVAGSSTWTACNATIVVANNNCTEVTRAQAQAGTPFYLAPNSMAWRQIREEDKRDAFFGAIQWRPSDRLEFNIDGQYSTRLFTEHRRDFNISEMRYGLTNVVYDANHVLRSFNGLSSLESTAAELSRDEEYLGGGAAIKWTPSDRLTVAADASYSRTIRTEIERNARLRTDPFDVNNTRNYFATAPFSTSSMRVPYTFSLPAGSYVPVVTFDPRLDITNHALFWDDARMRRDESRRYNKIIAGRLDATYELGGFLSAISAGGRVSRLTFNDYDDRKEFNLNPAMTEDRRINNLCRVAFPQTDFLSAAKGNTISSWATFDPNCLFREYVGSEDPGRNADVRSVANRDVTEEVYAGYVMAEYRGSLGSLPIRGNFGVRVVNTNVTSNGLRSDLDVVTNPDGSIRLVANGKFATVTIKNDTTRVLPSVNAIFDLRDDIVLRLAGYRAMSRPAPSSLGAGRTITLESGTAFTSIDDAINNITANGSPRLEPLMSWNGDVALEWYANRDSLFSATLYYKQFTGGYLPVVRDEQFTIGGTTVTIPVTQTQNSDDKSRIWGLEVTAAHRLSWLPKPLDGLGFKVSYNYADSDFKTHDIRYGNLLDPVTGNVSPGIIPPANISGYSKHVLSAQAYYEIGPVSLQGIYNYRSNYYQDFVAGNTQLRYVDDNNTFDFRASLDLMKNVALRFEAINIFDEPKVTYMPVQGSTRQYHFYGPRYFLGLRARL